MAELKNKLPQEGTATSGESLPVYKAGCPTDSEGGINPTTTTTRGGNQPSVAATNTGERKRINLDNTLEVVIVRDAESPKSATTTTTGEITFQWPTLKGNVQRKHSFIGEADKKRRRESFTSLPGTPYKKRESPEVFVLQETIKKVKELAESLFIMANDMHPNTKKEIKNQTSVLVSQIKNFDQRIIREWLEERRYENIEKISIDKDIQTSPKKLQMETNDMETQTPIWMGQEEENLAKIEEITDLNGFIREEKKKWPETMFRNTTVEVGNPIETQNETVKVVFVEPADQRMEKSIQKLYKERYPELISGNDRYEIYEQSIKIRGETNKTNINRKIIKAMMDGTDQTTWEVLCKIKEDTMEYANIAMHHLDNMDTTRLQKMVEAIFQTTKIRTTIYTTRAKQEAPTPRLRITSILQQPKKRRSEAIIVEQKGKKYSDILNSVKAIVTGTKIGKNITDVRQTKDGRLLVQVTEGAADIIQKLTENMEARIEHKPSMKDKKTLHIHALDGTITKSEVQETLIQHLQDRGQMWNSLTVGDLRPAARGRQAVTVVTDTETAKQLLAMERVIMGITPCKITERLEVSKCIRCWEAGHQAKDCEGTDRRGDCLNCGRTGHLAAKCANKAACPLCKKEGHKAWTPACSRFKEMAKANKDKAEKKAMGTGNDDVFRSDGEAGASGGEKSSQKNSVVQVLVEQGRQDSSAGVSPAIGSVSPGKKGTYYVLKAVSNTLGGKGKQK